MGPSLHWSPSSGTFSGAFPWDLPLGPCENVVNFQLKGVSRKFAFLSFASFLKFCFSLERELGLLTEFAIFHQKIVHQRGLNISETKIHHFAIMDQLICKLIQVITWKTVYLVMEMI